MRLFAFCSLLLILAYPCQAGLLDRCSTYSSDVRMYHWKELGINYPWEYAVAQLAQESACRNRISLDGVGSEGLPQITFKVWRDKLSGVGIDDLKTVSNQLRAQAVINWEMWRSVSGANAPKLWIAFQDYNGGPLVLKEIKRAGSLEHSAWRLACNRKDVKVSPTQTRNACDINAEYSVNISAMARKYWGVKDSPQYPYW